MSCSFGKTVLDIYHMPGGTLYIRDTVKTIKPWPLDAFLQLGGDRQQNK